MHLSSQLRSYPLIGPSDEAKPLLIDLSNISKFWNVSLLLHTVIFFLYIILLPFWIELSWCISCLYLATSVLQPDPLHPACNLLFKPSAGKFAISRAGPFSSRQPEVSWKPSKPSSLSKKEGRMYGLIVARFVASISIFIPHLGWESRCHLKFRPSRWWNEITITRWFLGDLGIVSIARAVFHLAFLFLNFC